ncbi:MAG: FecR family protein [Bdellovibrionota bacterium]
MQILLGLALLVSFGNISRAEDEICQTALVEDLSGSVSLVSPDGSQKSVAADQALQPGDLLHTEPGAWADLRLCDGTGLRVGEDSKFYFDGAKEEQGGFVSWAFNLVRGSLRAAVVGDGNGDRVKFRVRTTSAALGVRGTEFVVDATDSGKGETTLHTLEGEVLMGPKDDFEKLGTLHGPDLAARFEPVGKENMSVIHSGEAHPLRAAAFRLADFRHSRGHLFSRELRKKNREEIRQRFLNARQRREQTGRASRPLFDRTREKLEKRVESPGQGARANQAAERAKAREARQAQRRERMAERARGKAQRKVWRKGQKTNN